MSRPPARAPGRTTTAAQGEAALSSAPGTPLDAPTRRWMEQRFGHSFDGVRVHADGAAQAAAQALSTRAFAVGRHIAFAPGQYQPGSTSGRRLLAHELAHTLQQGRGGGVHAHGEPAAEAAAANVLAGRAVAAQPGHAASVQRDGPAHLQGPRGRRWWRARARGRVGVTRLRSSSCPGARLLPGA